VEEPSLLELLDQVEAEMNRLRKAVIAQPEVPKTKKAARPPALGKGLSQLFGGSKRAE